MKRSLHDNSGSETTCNCHLKNSIKDKFKYVLIKSHKRFTELWKAVFLSLKSEMLSEAFQLRFKRVVTEEW